MSRIFLYCIVDSEGVFAEAAIKNEQGYTGGFLFKKILTFSRRLNISNSFPFLIMILLYNIFL